MKTVFTSADKNDALEFAYGMGLKRPVVTETEEENSAMSFARSMGLRLNEDTFTFRHRNNGTGAMAPQLRFV